MRNKPGIRLALAFAAVFAISASGIVTASSPDGLNKLTFVKAQDSLRVKTIVKGMHKLADELQESVIPKLSGDEKKNMKEMTASFKTQLKESESILIKDSLVTDFTALDETGKKALLDLEKTVSKIKSALPEKSVAYHQVTMEYIPLYRVTQELQPDSKIPFLATYKEPYDPNVRGNNQVIMVGAYLNFYLEYRISVGGIDMGPDIVDESRVVFTFPDKLLAEIKEPTFIEIKASPQKKTGSGAGSKFVDNQEQHAYLLVYPRKQK